MVLFVFTVWDPTHTNITHRKLIEILVDSKFTCFLSCMATAIPSENILIN